MQKLTVKSSVKLLLYLDIRKLLAIKTPIVYRGQSWVAHFILGTVCLITCGYD